MRFRKLGTLVAFGVVAAGLAVASASASTSKSTAYIAAAPAFGAELGNAPSSDWPTVGGNLWNQGYSTLNQINDSNVKDIKQVWTQSIHGISSVELEGGPSVYRGIMYAATGEGDMAALDARTGEIVWKVPFTGKPSNAYGISAQRGVALGDGQVYLAQNDGKLWAYDQKTGHVNWKSSNVLPQDIQLSPPTPVYYDGKVFLGTHGGGDAGQRGSFSAYDAKTGLRLWRFYTVPQPGELGSGSWPAGTNEWMVGGGASWTWSAIDPATHTVYFTGGNAGPYSGRGPGDNLFTSSVIALDTNTGAYKWHFQAIHHDMWDYDCPATPLLFDATVRGAKRNGIAVTCKTGYAYLLDRNTGAPLVGIHEEHVPTGAQSLFQNASKTQPIPVGDAFAPQIADPKVWAGPAPDGKPYRLGRLFSSYGPNEFTAVAPGLTGGGDWPRMSYDVKRQLLFVCSSATVAAFKAVPAADGKASAAGFNAYQSGVPKAYKGQLTGSFTAIDVATNKIVWQKKYTDGVNCYSGSIATAGNLALVGTSDGTFRAYSSATGQQLWSKKLPYPIAAPPVTYEVNGKQYISIYDGGQTALLGGAKTKKDLLVTFALN